MTGPVNVLGAIEEGTPLSPWESRSGNALGVGVYLLI